jgi:predicted ArsR family transcriptional regulator
MFSIYETTRQGEQTRSQLLKHLQPHESLSRDDLVQRSGLTYDQVRRQTKNLCIAGILESRLEQGKRMYQLKRVSKSVFPTW